MNRGLPMGHFLAPALADGIVCGLRICRTNAWLVTHLELALDSATRTRGLLGRNELPPGAGLIIAPSQGIHTFGMRFPIDVVFVTWDGRVVRYRSRVAPRRVAVWPFAFAVVELPAGAAERAGLRVGDRLVVAPAEEQTAGVHAGHEVPDP